MDLYQYWKGLDKESKIQFCKKAKVSYGYMETHLIHGRKKPSMDTVQAIIDASNDHLNHKSIFDFFLNKPRSVA